MSSATYPSLSDYAKAIVETDRLPEHDIQPVLFGLYGEVGDIMTLVKQRSRGEYVAERAILVEELGDVLWYLLTLCRRLAIPLADVIPEHNESGRVNVSLVRSDIGHGRQLAPLSETVKDMGIALGRLLSHNECNDTVLDLIRRFWNNYRQCLAVAQIDLAEAIEDNLAKVRGRFMDPMSMELPTFDCGYPEDERLPNWFRIEVIEKQQEAVVLRWKGEPLGEPLYDCVTPPDNYRFHDVFHIAFAAILHWSPTFRKLTGRKRRSNPLVDQEQDGGRAIVVEEGLVAWIFMQAKGRAFFEDCRCLPFDMLKQIGQFVTGFEAEACPLSLWERAILRGFEAFRTLAEKRNGIIVGDRAGRDISYENRSP